MDISIKDIDWSRDVGKLNEGASKPRDLIVKSTSYRSRKELYLRRLSLKTCSYTGVYANGDLSRARSLLLFKAREIVRSKHLRGALGKSKLKSV